MDLTPLWRDAHAHLRPLTDILPLPAGEPPAHCSLCGADQAVAVVANVRFGSEHWRSGMHLHYCRSCQGYSLPPQAGLPADAPPTAVDARLWSATPTFLNLEPTTRCNYSCWYCVGRHMVQADIAVDDFVRLLDNFPSVRAIALVGEGEPLLHKGFFDMARTARERGVRVLTISNGSAFNATNVRKICEAGITYISVSIDSNDPATFAASRIGGKLAKVLSGIQSLAQYRDGNGYRYPRIGLKGSLFAGTEKQIPAIVELARAHGVDIFESFQPLNPMRTYVPIYPKDKLSELPQIDRIAASIAHDSDPARHGMKTVQQFCAEEGIRLDKNGQPNGIRRNCDEEWIYTLLSGDVTPCCQIKTPLDPAWNLFRAPLEAILKDQHYENVRFNLWNGLFPAYCTGCWKTR